ncbi:DUF6404 family protein [Vibrio sp. SCSIO 43132]|uniref:DUF6404 family protein n=1 Tax=Vibrio sp. SCSIO 43132 TaxID=2779363 RepID=UPI001CA955E6
MVRVEFIRLHLMEKGVPADLVNPSPFIWSKHLYPLGKPLIFQSHLQIMMHSLSLAIVWGGVLWMLLHDFYPEKVISSVVFGVLIGASLWVRVLWNRKKLCLGSWEEWCENNYETTHELSPTN